MTDIALMNSASESLSTNSSTFLLSVNNSARAKQKDKSVTKKNLTCNSLPLCNYLLQKIDSTEDPKCNRSFKKDKKKRQEPESPQILKAARCDALSFIDYFRLRIVSSIFCRTPALSVNV